MKLIRNIIYLIIIIIAVYMLYTNRDKLVTYFEYLFKNSNDIIIEKSNEYKRNYNYLKAIII
jgi:flagellar biosynthesis/type III secretory pathway M-ring protein FliF/YscJ